MSKSKQHIIDSNAFINFTNETVLASTTIGNGKKMILYTFVGVDGKVKSNIEVRANEDSKMFLHLDLAINYYNQI